MLPGFVPCGFEPREINFYVPHLCLYMIIYFSYISGTVAKFNSNHLGRSAPPPASNDMAGAMSAIGCQSSSWSLTRIG
jgi:hypothetical protein